MLTREVGMPQRQDRTGAPRLPRSLAMIEPEFELICLRHQVLGEFSCVLGCPIPHQL